MRKRARSPDNQLVRRLTRSWHVVGERRENGKTLEVGLKQEERNEESEEEEEEEQEDWKQEKANLAKQVVEPGSLMIRRGSSSPASWTFGEFSLFQPLINASQRPSCGVLVAKHPNVAELAGHANEHKTAPLSQGGRLSFVKPQAHLIHPKKNNKCSSLKRMLISDEKYHKRRRMKDEVKRINGTCRRQRVGSHCLVGSNCSCCSFFFFFFFSPTSSSFTFSSLFPSYSASAISLISEPERKRRRRFESLIERQSGHLREVKPAVRGSSKRVEVAGDVREEKEAEALRSLENEEVEKVLESNRELKGPKTSCQRLGSHCWAKFYKSGPSIRCSRLEGCNLESLCLAHENKHHLHQQTPVNHNSRSSFVASSFPGSASASAAVGASAIAIKKTCRLGCNISKIVYDSSSLFEKANLEMDFLLLCFQATKFLPCRELPVTHFESPIKWLLQRWRPDRNPNLKQTTQTRQETKISYYCKYRHSPNGLVHFLTILYSYPTRPHSSQKFATITLLPRMKPPFSVRWLKSFRRQSVFHVCLVVLLMEMRNNCKSGSHSGPPKPLAFLPDWPSTRLKLQLRPKLKLRQFFTYHLPLRSYSADLSKQRSFYFDTLRLASFLVLLESILLLRIFALFIINNKQKLKCERNSNGSSGNILKNQKANGKREKLDVVEENIRETGEKISDRKCPKEQNCAQKASIKEVALHYHERNLVARSSNLKDESDGESSWARAVARLKSFSASTIDQKASRVISENPWSLVEDGESLLEPLIKCDALQLETVASSSFHDNHYYPQNKATLTKWQENNSTKRRRISMIDCNCIYSNENSSVTGDDNKTRLKLEFKLESVSWRRQQKLKQWNKKQPSNAISNGGREEDRKNQVCECLFGFQKRDQHGQKRWNCQWSNRKEGCQSRESLSLVPLNCWLLILIVTFSFLSKPTNCSPLSELSKRETEQQESNLDEQKQQLDQQRHSNGKYQLWLSLLSSLLANELGGSATKPSGGSKAAQEHLAARLANWPSQESAALFYMDLLERRRANKFETADDENDWSQSCRRVSLAELTSKDIPIDLVPFGSTNDQETTFTTFKSENDDAGGSTIGQDMMTKTLASNSRKMRVSVEMNEIIEGPLLSKLNQESSEFARAAKLAVGNANIISRLLIHPESQVIISIATQENFFKYLLESKVRQLASSYDTQLLHSAGLIFFDLDDKQDDDLGDSSSELPSEERFEGAGSDSLIGNDRRRREPSIAREIEGAEVRSLGSLGESYNEATSSSTPSKNPPASLAMGNSLVPAPIGNSLGALEGITQMRMGRGTSIASAPAITTTTNVAARKRSRSSRSRGNVNGMNKIKPASSQKNKLKSYFAPQAVLNYGASSLVDGQTSPRKSNADFSIRIQDLAKHPIGSNANSHNDYLKPETAFLSRWLLERDADSMIELEQRLSNLLNDEASTQSEQTSADKESIGLLDGRWFSPYFDCGFSNRWLLTYSLPFFASSKTRHLTSNNNNNNNNKNDDRAKAKTFNTSNRNNKDKIELR